MSTDDVEIFVDESYNYAQTESIGGNAFILSTEAQSFITTTQLITRVN